MPKNPKIKIILAILFCLWPLKSVLAATPDFSLEVGTADKALNWTACDNDDIPDAPARAFIDAEGKVQLISTHFVARRNVGDNLNSLEHKCEIIFNSHKNPDPRKYDDFEWLVSPYTLNGTNIYALIHTEYHGWDHNNCNSPNPNTNCWWNSINFATSTDGGRTYTHLPPISQNIANSPVDYNPNNTQDHIGFFESSNIVYKAGYYYALLNQHNPPGGWGTCIMRTNNLADPKSWRFWDGNGFNLKGYEGNPPRCQPLSPSPPHYQVSFNTYLNKYISLWGDWNGLVSYAVSDDLIHWSETKTFTGGGAYNSLIQPGDPTRNFEQTGRSPWLYYVKDYGGLNRTLTRIRIRFTKPGDEGKYELLDLQMNEKRGIQTLDSSFYGNNGNLTGGATFLQDSSNNYLRFNGSGKLEIPHHSSVNASGKLTIKAKIRISTISAGTYPTIIRKEDGSKRNYGLYLTPTGVLHFSLSGLNSLIGSTGTKTINNGYWHEIMLTYDDVTKTASYYVDGQLDIQRYHGASLTEGTNSSPAVIGDQGFNGNLDYLTLYNYIPNYCSVSLSSAQISEGSPVTVTFSGNPSGGQKVKLWLTDLNGQPLTVVKFNGSDPQLSTYDNKSYYLLSEASDTNSHSGSLTAPPGKYFLSCDINYNPFPCSGNPFCDYENKSCSPSGSTVCNSVNCTSLNLYSCSETDNQLLTILSSTSGSLNFQVKLQGIGSQVTNKNVRVILKQAGVEKYRFDNLPVSANTSGVFSGTISNIAPGTYDTYVKGWAHLQKKFTNVSLNSGTNQQDWSSAELKAGDLAGGGVSNDLPDNMIDASDLGKLISVFNPLGSVPSGTLADLNSDGRVDASDLGLLISNFNPGVYGDQ